MTPFLRGLADPFRGLLFVIRRPRLFSLAVVPIVITSVLYVGLLLLLLLHLDDLLDLAWKTFADGWPIFLYYLAYLVLAPTIALALLAILPFVAGAVSGPFLFRIVRKVREEIEGRRIDPPGGAYADLVYPALMQVKSLLVLLTLYACTVPVHLLVPGSSVFLGPLQILASAFLLAVSFLDYPLETEPELPGFRGRFRYGCSHLGRALGFGTALLGLTAVPLIGFLLPPAAAAGAALFYCDERNPG